MLAAAANAAQQPSGSETQAALAQGVYAGSARMTSASSVLESTVGAGLTAPAGGSANFVLRHGMIGTLPPIGTARPLVFGTDVGVGERAGNETIRVFGMQFQEAGASTAVVRMGGEICPVATVTGPNVIEVLTPNGIDPLGNPKGPVEVTVVNINGTTKTAHPALFYAPGPMQLSHARLGSLFQLSLHHLAGAFSLVLIADSPPIPPLPIPPLEGTLALSGSPLTLAPFAPVPGLHEEFGIALPDAPVLAGTVLEFQLVEFTGLSPLAGTFTNVVPVTLHP